MCNDSIHQARDVPVQVHGVHERPRNSARVRLRLRFVVSQCCFGTRSDCGQAPCPCALEHVRHLGVRERDIEKVVISEISYFTFPDLLATVTIKNAADRIENHDGSAAR